MSDMSGLALLAVIRGLRRSGSIDDRDVESIAQSLMAAGNDEHERRRPDEGKALINLGYDVRGLNEREPAADAADAPATIRRIATRR